MPVIRFPFDIKLNGKYISKNTKFEACTEETESLTEQGGKAVGGESNGGTRKTKAKTTR